MKPNFEAKDLNQKIDNPEWTDEENRDWDAWVDNGTKTAAHATADIEKAQAARRGKQPAGNESTTITNKQVTEAAQRVVTGSEVELLQPAPPKPGETDEQIRQRHRDALKSRDDSPAPGFDPELSAQMLKRGSEGNYLAPEQSQVQ